VVVRAYYLFDSFSHSEAALGVDTFTTETYHGKPGGGVDAEYLLTPWLGIDLAASQTHIEGDRVTSLAVGPSFESKGRLQVRPFMLGLYGHFYRVEHADIYLGPIAGFVQTSGGGYLWYDVIGIAPSRDRTLEEVKDKVEARWRDDKVAERVAAKAADMLDRLKAGAPFAEIAAANGVKVDTKTGVQRARGAEPLSTRAVDAAFRTAKGAPGMAEGNAPTERVVFVVTDVTVPPFDAASTQAQRYNERLRRMLTEELFEQYVRRLQTDLGTTINQDAIARIRGGSVE